MKRTVVVTVVLALAICATAVWSQGPPGQGGPGGPGGMRGFGMSCPAMAVMPPHTGMLDRMADALQLTDDQITKLKETMTKNDETVRPLVQKSADASKALRAALLASDYNAQTVKDLAAKAEKAEADVIAASIEVWTQIRSILTKDQAAALQEAMNMPRQGPGPAGPPPGGPGVPPPPGQ